MSRPADVTTAEPETAVEEIAPDFAQRSWQFIGHEPTVEEVRQLLGTLPPVWGVVVGDFHEYVQALPSKVKVQRPSPQNPKLMVTESIEAWTLYMTVAGRVAMLTEAQRSHEWTVTIDPEPATQIPGMLQHGDGRIVYREHVEISTKDGRLVGRRPGMAWVPYSGGSAAAGSNPYEKVETAARGRAIGAWGFGVLPGSGIATLEEMQGVAQNAAALAGGEQPRGRGDGTRPAGKMARAEMLPRVKQLIETVRLERGNSEQKSNNQTAAYLTEKLGVVDVQDPETGGIRWEAVKDGHLQLLERMLQQVLLQIQETKGQV